MSSLKALMEKNRAKRLAIQAKKQADPETRSAEDYNHSVGSSNANPANFGGELDAEGCKISKFSNFSISKPQEFKIPQVANDRPHGELKEDDSPDDRDIFREPEETDAGFGPESVANANPANLANFREVADLAENLSEVASEVASAQAQLEVWRLKLDGLQEPDCRELQALISAAKRFIDSPLAIEAIRCGWDATELFGVNTFAPRIRRDSWGLVATTAWCKQPHELINLDAKCATFSITGATLKSLRTPTGYQYARPLWNVLKDACGGSRR